MDLVHLRRLASRSRPPVEICSPDLGTRGPILGTIHASKGREADTVALVLPPSQHRSPSDSQAEELEEGRVYYVGATRAREALVTAHNGGSRASYLDSGRVYRLLPARGSGTPRVQLEVGREGDTHRLAHLGWSRAGEIQRILAESAHRSWTLKGVSGHDQEFKYSLVLKRQTSTGATVEVDIGQMGESFHRDLGDVWSRVDADSRFKPGDTIDHLYLVGATTVALSDGELSGARPPYSSSGFALSPLVKGFTVVRFPYRRRRRSRW